MTGDSAIVTGGAQNIGGTIARALAGAGAKVMIADLNGERAKATVDENARDTGAHCLGAACDATRADQIEALVAATVGAFGGV